MAEKKINGRTFKTEPVLATQAIIMEARLASIASHALHRLPEILRGIGNDKPQEAKEQAAAAAIQAFGSVFANTDPEQLAELISDVLKMGMIKRESGSYDPIDLDGDFTGRQKDLIPVVVWVLQEQFGDFFSDLPGVR